MTFEKLKEAETECERFLMRVKALRAAYEKQKAAADHSQHHYYGLSFHPMETGAVRRASLDLTRALAKVRSYTQ